MPSKKKAIAARSKRKPGSGYEERTRTPSGRQWLDGHPAAADAYWLAMQLLGWADALVDRELPDSRRKELARQIAALKRLHLGIDTSTIDGKRRVMVGALEYGLRFRRAAGAADELRPEKELTDVQIRETDSMLALAGLSAPHDVLRRAVSLWTSPGTRSRNGVSEALHALATALRCAGETSPKNLRRELDKLREE